jgi:hypothetical protein
MSAGALPDSGSAGPVPAPVAAVFSAWAAGLGPEAPPARLREVFEFVLLDAIGLCVAAREADYLRATLAACDSDGACTAIGQARGLDPAGAALVNGTAIHGEDYDDTFEGTPVHSGAAIAPALLAACEGYGLGGRDLLRGMAVGTELMCRLALVAPTAVHRAGFHPTGVIGALGARRRSGSTPPGWPPPSGSRAASPRASSSTWPRAPGPSGCIPVGPPRPDCAPRAWRRRDSWVREP